MASSKHTPAPWAYEETSGAIYYADGDVEPIIAGINQDNTSQTQADADGRLIAEAPAMLAALRACLPLWRHATSAEAEVRARVIAVIAKATGEA